MCNSIEEFKYMSLLIPNTMCTHWRSGERLRGEAIKTLCTLVTGPGINHVAYFLLVCIMEKHNHGIQ